MTAACSWCSTEVPEGATACPNCGANLVPDPDADVPGVTAVDAASIIRSRSAASQPRSRLLSWISGESTVEQPSKAEQQAIAPPAPDVQREILRLELAALQAEADALRAEAVAEGRTVAALEPQPNVLRGPSPATPDAAQPVGESEQPVADEPNAGSTEDPASA
jgi:hypothetical protein